MTQRAFGTLPHHPSSNRPCCGKKCPDIGVRCTRRNRHPGSHMANATDDGTVAIWDTDLMWDSVSGWI